MKPQIPMFEPSERWLVHHELAERPGRPWEQEDIDALLPIKTWQAYERAVSRQEWTPRLVSNLFEQVFFAQLVSPARAQLTPDRHSAVHNRLIELRQLIKDGSPNAHWEFIRIAGRLSFFESNRSFLSAEDLDTLEWKLKLADSTPTDLIVLRSYLSLLDRDRFQVPEERWDLTVHWLLHEFEDDEYESCSDEAPQDLASLMIIDPTRADSLRTPAHWGWMIRYLRAAQNAPGSWWAGSDRLESCAYLRIIAAGGVEQRSDGVWQLRQQPLGRPDSHCAPARRTVSTQ